MSEELEKDSAMEKMLEDFEFVSFEMSDFDSDKVNKKTGKPIMWKKIDFTFNYMGEELSTYFVLNRYLLDSMSGIFKDAEHDCNKDRKCSKNYCVKTGGHISAEQKRNEAAEAFIVMAFREEFLQDFLDITEEAGGDDSAVQNLVAFFMTVLLPKVQPQES